MPVRPFGSFYTGARTGNAAAGHAVNAYAPISPFSIYCQRLVCDGREWCPRSAARKKKTVPANDRYRNTLRLFPYVGIIQITVHSQPAVNQLPFFLFQHCKTFRNMCQDRWDFYACIRSGADREQSAIWRALYCIVYDMIKEPLKSEKQPGILVAVQCRCESSCCFLYSGTG